MREERKRAGERSFYFGGYIMFLQERYEKSKEYIDRVLKLNEKSKEGLILKGWLELMSGKDAVIKKSVKYFDDANE